MDDNTYFRVSNRTLDFSFPWHLDKWTKVDGRWQERLISRHRTKVAAESAKQHAEKETTK